MIYLIIGIVLLLVSLIFYFCFYLKANKIAPLFNINDEDLEQIFSEYDFVKFKTFFINQHLILAINKKITKLLFILNFNPNQPTGYNVVEILPGHIIEISKSNYSLNIKYNNNGTESNLLISPVQNEICDIIHNFYLKAKVNIIQAKYGNKKFDLVASSDYKCDYCWAYSSFDGFFACLEQQGKIYTEGFFLPRVYCTIDTKYNYFELPYKGTRQQLFVYELNFLNDLLLKLLDYIKNRTVCILKNKIYYDSYNDVIFLTDNTTRYVAVLLKNVNEVFFSNKKIYFSEKKSDMVINFICNEEYMKAINDFVISYNLRKLLTNFDYTTDKIINITNNTKLIIDYTRYRLIYCANLDTLSKFSYIVISFSDIKNVSVEGRKLTPYIRIITNDKRAIDISCSKYEVASYTEALIRKIKNEKI